MAILTDDRGTLDTFTTATNGTNYLIADGKAALLVLYKTDGAAGGTLKLQVSVDNGTTWVDVASSSAAITSSTPATISITNPLGLYRAVCTADTNGTHTVSYIAGPTQ